MLRSQRIRRNKSLPYSHGFAGSKYPVTKHLSSSGNETLRGAFTSRFSEEDRRQGANVFKVGDASTDFGSISDSSLIILHF